MRALVTGANGFLGSWLCRHLLAGGHAVRALVRPGSDAGALAGLDVERVPG
ncbi:MAG: NAD-dependent epimerase/dehydratase family protein, partial [Anaeromyxobacteraceae bacterium]